MRVNPLEQWDKSEILFPYLQGKISLTATKDTMGTLQVHPPLTSHFCREAESFTYPQQVDIENKVLATVQDSLARP